MNIYDIFCTLAEGVISQFEPHVACELFFFFNLEGLWISSFWPTGWPTSWPVRL